MRRLAMVAGFVLATAAWAGCGDSPADVLETLESAAAEGNAERFAAQFTKDSRPFAQALLSLYQTRYPLDSRREFTPLRMLGRSDVIEETDRGGTVALRVKLRSSGEVATLVFKREDGAWLLDLLATDRENRGDAEDAP
ncbi:MAG TPA: hypothetical protein PK313_06265 [Myxococcota bacterium]|jgi:hypothetical protein|nr:hypothetical protein [Myxococcota bacterium]